jgi:cellulose synthase/poly-beta-1,6-N-acetylglucosamine synthase-like glycosyltransferase
VGTLALFSAVAIAFTWVGYPVLVWMLARGKPRRTTNLEATGVDSHPLVTVALATRADDQAVAERVVNLLASDHPIHALEVVVALDAARPRSDLAAVLSPWPQVRVVPGDGPKGKAPALNAALREARGSIVVFADSAQRFDRLTIPRLVEALGRDPELACVSGALSIPSGGILSWYWRLERWLRAMEARLHSPVGVTGAVYAMRRDCWSALPAGLILDDVFVPMQAVLRGWRVGFRRDAVAVDPRAFSAAGEGSRKTRTLTGVYQLCALLPAILSPRRNPIWFQFVCHKLLRMATPLLLLLFVVGFTWWLAGVLSPLMTATVLGGGSVVVALLLAVSGAARRMAREFVAVQVATLRATRNALRAQWDVW